MTIFRKAMSSLEETRNPISLGINAQGHTVSLLGIHAQLRYVRIVAVINQTSVLIKHLVETPLKVPLCIKDKVKRCYVICHI